MFIRVDLRALAVVMLKVQAFTNDRLKDGHEND
jgi:hypothetical protein